MNHAALRCGDKLWAYLCIHETVGRLTECNRTQILTVISPPSSTMRAQLWRRRRDAPASCVPGRHSASGDRGRARPCISRDVRCEPRGVNDARQSHAGLQTNCDGMEAITHALPTSDGERTTCNSETGGVGRWITFGLPTIQLAVFVSRLVTL